MRRLGSPQPPGPLARALYRLPIWLYRARLGALVGTRLVVVDHVGRRSGRPFRTVLDVVHYDPDGPTVTVVSGYGASSDWYRNLIAHPDTTIVVGSRRLRVRAVPMPPVEAGDVLVDYARRRPRRAAKFAAFMGFEIDGSDEDYRATGAEVSMIRLVAHQP